MLLMLRGTMLADRLTKIEEMLSVEVEPVPDIDALEAVKVNI